MSAEQDFLARVAAQLGRSPEAAPPRFTPSRPLPDVGPKGAEALAERFQKELERINGVVHRVSDASQVAPTIVRILEEALGPARAGAAGNAGGTAEPNGAGATAVARWSDPVLDEYGIDQALEGAGYRVLAYRPGDDGRAFVEQVEKAPAGIVACDAAIAETGTLVMASSPNRGRTVSLLPPVLIAVLRKEDIVFDSVRVFRRLAQSPMASQVIFKSGPSRSSDIENDLTIGVHGPGALHVILL